MRSFHFILPDPPWCLMLALLPMTAGCVTEEVIPEDGRIFKTPTDLDDSLWSAGVVHGVNIYLEVNLRKDIPSLPPGSEDFRQQALLLLVPDVEGTREVYSAMTGRAERLKSVPEVVYDMTRFEVGSFRYPSRPGAKLYVFKKRRGSLEFEYRGQKIRIETDREWTPAIYWNVHNEREKPPAPPPGRRRGLPGKVLWIHEIIKVGTATIETDSRWGAWRVNGKDYRPSKDRLLKIQGATEFDG